MIVRKDRTEHFSPKQRIRTALRASGGRFVYEGDGVDAGALQQVLGSPRQNRPEWEYSRGEPAPLRILTPSPNATNGAFRATRRESLGYWFDCGAGALLYGVTALTGGGLVPI